MSNRRTLLILGGAAALLPVSSKWVQAQCPAQPPAPVADPAIMNFNNAVYAFNCRHWDDLRNCLDPQAIYYKIKSGGPVGGPAGGGRDVVVQTMMQDAVRDNEFFTPIGLPNHNNPKVIVGPAAWFDEGNPWPNGGESVTYVMKHQTSGSYLLTSLFATPGHP